MSDLHTEFWVFNRECELTDTNPVIAWLNENAASYYYTNVLSVVLDNVVLNDWNITENFCVYIFHPEIAIQFRLMFPEWLPIELDYNDRKIALSIIKKIVPIIA